MKKKVLSVILMLSILGSLMAGCGQSNGVQESGDSETVNSANEVNEDSEEADAQEPAAANGEVETVIMYSPFVGNNEDKEAVVAAINDITREEIGVELQWEQFDVGQWFQQYSLFLSGSDEIDILFNFGGITTAVSQGAALNITDLIDEYGTGIKEELGEYIVSGEVDGALYGLIPKTIYAYVYGIDYRKDIVEELGLEEQVAQVTDIEDWGEILAAVKEAYPEITPYVTATGTTMYNFHYGNWDYLADTMGVLMNSGTDTEIVNLFETDEYARLCGIMSDWYQAGYTSKDIQTQTDSFDTLCSQDVAFSTLSATDFNTEFSVSAGTGKEIGTIHLGEPFAKTYSDGAYTVMANSKHAKAAVKFMNMVYTDTRILDLMSYGVEGVHYQVLDDGTFDYLDGQDASTCTYHDQLGITSNKVKRSLWCTDNPDLQTEIVEYNESAIKSYALGFVFDPTNVSNQITEIDNIFAKYRGGLETGSMDTEETLAAFNEELKNAGIDDVIAEKQQQLDNWKANQ